MTVTFGGAAIVLALAKYIPTLRIGAIFGAGAQSLHLYTQDPVDRRHSVTEQSPDQVPRGRPTRAVSEVGTGNGWFLKGIWLRSGGAMGLRFRNENRSPPKAIAVSRNVYR